MSFKRYMAIPVILIMTAMLSLGTFALAYAGTPVAWERLSGMDRYATMRQIVKTGFTSSEYAIVASGENYPDALAASALAGSYNAPVILTKSGELSPDAKYELSILNVKHVVIVGGPAAVSVDVSTAISNMGISVMRASGANRVATSLEVAKAVNVSTHPSMVIIATGHGESGFADALSIGPWAYKVTAPIVLVDANGKLSDEAITAIKGMYNVTDVIIVGGTAVVSDDVKTQLGASAYTFTRLAGADRYETSAAIAEWEMTNGLHSGKVAVATGRNFPDALAGAAFCGKGNIPLVMADDANFTNAQGVVSLNADSFANGYIFGGVSAVGPLAESWMKAVTGNVDYFGAYKPLLAAAQAMSADFASFNYPELKKADMRYALFDVEGNGTMELIVTDAAAPQSMRQYIMFTVKGGTPVNMGRSTFGHSELTYEQTGILIKRGNMLDDFWYTSITKDAETLKIREQEIAHYLVGALYGPNASKYTEAQRSEAAAKDAVFRVHTIDYPEGIGKIPWAAVTDDSLLPKPTMHAAALSASEGDFTAASLQP